MTFEILIINPGSTTTKVALFRKNEKLAEQNFVHTAQELSVFDEILDQKEFRIKFIQEFLEQENHKVSHIDAIVARGGLLRPVPGGTYKINTVMLEDLNKQVGGQHASNLGGLLAYDLSEKLDCPSFIVDPSVVDELMPIARISGDVMFERKSVFHALNQKATAREVAQDFGKTYQNCNFIVAHLGGGITVGAHKKGKVIDVNNGLLGEGPFSPNRSGTLPLDQVIDFVASSKKPVNEIKKLLTTKSGITSYLKTNDLITVEQNIEEGDTHAELIYEAMAYQIAKEISSLAVALCNDLDAIILTGGMAHSHKLVERITNYVGWIGQIVVKAGENEMSALNEGGQRVLLGVEKALEYK